jgi:hypothetical protein
LSPRLEATPSLGEGTDLPRDLGEPPEGPRRKLPC